MAAAPLIEVLVCDDEFTVRVLMRELLEQDTGLRVVGEARDGEEVVQLALALAPHVILMDLSMPHRDGIEAISALAGAGVRAPVVVMSGFGSNERAGQALELGAYAYLEKGSDPDLLRATIRKAAARNGS